MIVSLQNSSTALTVLLRADIDPGDAVLLGHTLDEAIAVRPPYIRVDMAHVTYCGAAGVRTLLDAQEQAARGQVRLTLNDPSRIVRRVLQILDPTGLLKIHHSTRWPGVT